MRPCTPPTSPNPEKPSFRDHPTLQAYPDAYFNGPPKEPGVFDLSLCFAGSVSAGAYLAGVADFLIEALDAWETAKQSSSDPSIPRHRVRLHALAGTSGGGMTSAILGACLHRAHTPARGDTPTPPNINTNPLYVAWVKGIGIEHLLALDDLEAEDAHVLSLLCSDRILELATDALRGASEPVRRSYVASPLHVAMTTGNLNGITYNFEMLSGNQHGFSARAHEEVLRFALTADGSAGFPDQVRLALDQRPRAPRPQDWPSSWRLYLQSALATGAFPIGLLPREVQQEWTHCDPKVIAIHKGPAGIAEIAVLRADRSGSAGMQCGVCVDGGVFNNEPFNVAHDYLCGILGENPRDGTDAHRGVIMVDPLVNPDGDEFESILSTTSLITLAGGLVSRAYKNQARSHLRDWAMALDESVYSRYLINPVNATARGDEAICGSGLGAFGGFLSEAYREYDFRLGRRNCQQFLRHHFCLPIDNPLFREGGLEGAALDRWVVDRDSKPHLPIIPLFGKPGEVEEGEPKWPSADEFERVRDNMYQLLEKRVERVFDRLIQGLDFGPRNYSALGWAAGGRHALLDAIKKAIENGLRKKNLYA